MTSYARVAACLAATLLGSGCATRKYVRQQIGPLQTQVDRGVVEDRAQDSQIVQLAESSKTLNSDLLDLSRSVKKQGALTAGLSNMMAGFTAAASDASAVPPPAPVAPGSGAPITLDDYQAQGEAVLVQFASGSAWLSGVSKEAIDLFSARTLREKGYLVTVEGFTDSDGAADLNLALSQRRAQNVVAYLAGRHEIPIYRMFAVGLGSGNPVDWQRASASLAKNRRVEVRMYTPRSR